MRDMFGRTIDYLRISVTDRCNLRCRYCMPEHGIQLVRHEDILSFEEIIEVTRTAVDMGVSKIRLTGGEPLVRRGIVDLVRSLAHVEGVKDFAMTTNGVLLADHAEVLADAGLMRLNVSLDAIDASQYRRVTRRGDVGQVFAGIAAAVEAGLNPVKINCVAGPFTGESDIEAVKAYGRENGLEVRVVRQMDFATGCFSVVEGGTGGDCERCNRLRLSSNGHVRPCLFSDIGFSVRQLGPRRAIQDAVKSKPAAGGPCSNDWMVAIGG